MKLHRSEPLHTRDRDRARNTQNSAATPNRTAMPHTVAAVPKIPLRAAIHNIDGQTQHNWVDRLKITLHDYNIILFRCSRYSEESEHESFTKARKLINGKKFAAETSTIIAHSKRYSTLYSNAKIFAM
jgi:hypothetical protein